MRDGIHPVRNRATDDSIYQQGFTLLEMVLVLMIMGMVASLSVVFIDNEDNQLRYQESIQKLEAMQKATVTVKEYKDDFLFSGFVVDNGVLPSDAQDFISMPAGWITPGETYLDTTDPLNSVIRSRVQPYFRLTKKNLSNNIDFPLGGYTELADIKPSFYQRQGYRAGYISSGIDSAGNYKDAWGDDFIVREDASKQFNLAIDTSVKTDNTVSFIGDYDNNGVSDVNRNIGKYNWGLPLAELEINIENKNGTPVDNIVVGLIVFQNTNFSRPSPSTGDETEICKSCIQTYHFRKRCRPTDQTKQAITIPKNTIVLFSTTEIPPVLWQTEALEKIENDQTTCDPDDSGYAQNTDYEQAKNIMIPAGEHIVVVGLDSDDDGKLDEIKDTVIIKVIPRFTQPTVTLVIAP